MSERPLLWVKSGPLLPADTGGKIRTLQMLREINRLRPVTYLATKSATVPLDPAEEADPYATEKIWIDQALSPRLSPRFFLGLAANLLTTRPYSLSRHFSASLRARLIELDQSGRFEWIVCDFLSPALHFHRHDWQTPTVLFQHNMEAQIWRRLSQNHPNPAARLVFRLEHLRLRRWERKLSAAFDGVITVSPDDSRFAREAYHLPNVLGDVPPGVDAESFASVGEARAKLGDLPPRLAFLGSMDWLPNVEGICWFVREVYPALKARHPGAQLRIIGRKPVPAVRRLSEEDASIEVTGSVDDIRPCLQDCAALIVPLLSGGGTRIKILEGMAAGLPVLSTSVGAEGLPFESGRHLVLADGVKGFLESCCRLLQDAAQREAIALEGQHLVEAQYSWKAAAEQFLSQCRKITKARNSLV